MIDQYFSESCEQNKKPILSILKNYLYGKKHLLEIGSGTGQHAAYFASKFPSITWQTSDKAENHTGIKAWIDYSKLDNILPPMKLDVSKDAWPKNSYDIVFSANTAHIMSKENIHSMFTGISKVLLPENEFLLYGPFNIDGKYTADSNMEFDKALKIRDPGMGVRDIEWLEGIGAKNKIFLKDKINMPADNMILVWKQI
tara:strand:- start:113 stop:709 length:597 start_codon:yes stop_codon:yes gene_type:complete